MTEKRTKAEIEAALEAAETRIKELEQRNAELLVQVADARRTAIIKAADWLNAESDGGLVGFAARLKNMAEEGKL